MNANHDSTSDQASNDDRAPGSSAAQIAAAIIVPIVVLIIFLVVAVSLQFKELNDEIESESRSSVAPISRS